MTYSNPSSYQGSLESLGDAYLAASDIRAGDYYRARRQLRDKRSLSAAQYKYLREAIEYAHDKYGSPLIDPVDLLQSRSGYLSSNPSLPVLFAVGVAAAVGVSLLTRRSKAKTKKAATTPGPLPVPPEPTDPTPPRTDPSQPKLPPAQCVPVSFEILGQFAAQKNYKIYYDEVSTDLATRPPKADYLATLNAKEYLVMDCSFYLWTGVIWETDYTTNAELEAWLKAQEPVGPTTPAHRTPTTEPTSIAGHPALGFMPR